MRQPSWARAAAPFAARDEESTATGIYGVIVSAVMAASHAERVAASP
jgi:hypothetical protein